MNPKTAAPPSAAHLQDLVAGEVSLAGRLAHVALLLVALAVVCVVASLWLTEAALPLRTQVAFGALTAIGLAWVTYACWVLTTKRPLLAAHRIVAARMAVAFSALFVVGCLAVSVVTPDAAAARSAAAFGAGLCVIAVVQWRRAGRRVNALRSRREELQRALGRVL